MFRETYNYSGDGSDGLVRKWRSFFVGTLSGVVWILAKLGRSGCMIGIYDM